MLFEKRKEKVAAAGETIRRSPLDPREIAGRRGSLYPEPFRARMGDREKRRLGDVFGLTQFGVNLVQLGPGGQSALRHWHSLEDEFIYVLEGSLALVTAQGETPLHAGQCIGYRGGDRQAVHHMVNRGQEPALYLEIGSRVEGDQCFYPDDDLLLIETEAGTVAAHKSGVPYEDEQ